MWADAEVMGSHSWQLLGSPLTSDVVRQTVAGLAVFIFLRLMLGGVGIAG
jgi:hypothetical protein